MRRRTFTILLTAVLCLAAAGNAGAQEASVHGSYKSYLTGLHDLFHQNELYGRASQSLRLDSNINMGRRLRFNFSYALTPRVSAGSLLDSGGTVLGTPRSVYRAFELPDRLYPVKDGALQNLGLYQNLDRAFAALYLPHGDLYIGRQAISWGSAHVVTPTDIIAPYSFASVDTETKPGVDAVRLRIPVGMMNEIDLGFVAGDELQWSESALYARGKFYLLQTDLSLLTMDFKENLLTGLSATRSLGGAGSWIEAAWMLPEPPPEEVSERSPADPYCWLVDLEAVLEETRRLRDGTSPLVEWRTRVFNRIEDTLAM